MSRYGCVNISSYFAAYMIRYGPICKDWNSQCFRCCEPSFSNNGCQCSYKEACGCKQCIMHFCCLSISLHICVYIWQHWLPLRHWNEMKQTPLAEWRVHAVCRLCLYWITHSKGHSAWSIRSYGIVRCETSGQIPRARLRAQDWVDVNGCCSIPARPASWSL